MLVIPIFIRQISYQGLKLKNQYLESKLNDSKENFEVTAHFYMKKSP